MDYILNRNITIVDKERKKHSKASEEYVHVRFNYPDTTWDGWVPVEYRRTGIFIKQDLLTNVKPQIKKSGDYMKEEKRVQRTKPPPLKIFGAGLSQADLRADVRFRGCPNAA